MGVGVRGGAGLGEGLGEGLGLGDGLPPPIPVLSVQATDELGVMVTDVWAVVMLSVLVVEVHSLVEELAEVAKVCLSEDLN